jgi:ATP-binding cassette subfamily C protein LapB
MVESQDTTGDVTKNEKTVLAKIEPVKIEANPPDVKSSDIEDLPVDGRIESEKSLIPATILLLREYGIRKSGAAVRDAVDISHEYVGPKEAVSSLSSLGFKASFGRLNITNLAEEFFPLIAFKKNGEAFVVLTAPADGKIFITNPVNRKNQEISTNNYNSEFSQYAIIAKELNTREKEERSGHWFFSAFRKSKWIYVQVMIAAMVSNFLSLTTALFTMTVYDRVIPNGAFESLIALSIGVVIALGFDFLIKSLRASFVDTASKRADLEISRRLFARILRLSPTEQRQKNWCDGWYNS